jgi:hypothetical protein
MLAGAGLACCWSHDRAHRFFSRARWSPDELGLAAAKLVAALLVPAGEPVVVAIDDTLFRRRGKKVWAASWFHDGSAPGPAKTGTATTGSSRPWSSSCRLCDQRLIWGVLQNRRAAAGARRVRASSCHRPAWRCRATGSWARMPRESGRMSHLAGRACCKGVKKQAAKEGTLSWRAYRLIRPGR